MDMMTRNAILAAAMSAVTGDREETHGRPEDSFGRIAMLWEAYLDRTIDCHDVALMMALLKVARAKGNPHHADNWIDLAGYAACGAELVKPK
jgi:hypothetical protein